MSKLCPNTGCECKLTVCAIFDEEEGKCGILTHNRRTERHLKNISEKKEKAGVLARLLGR